MADLSRKLLVVPGILHKQYIRKITFPFRMEAFFPSKSENPQNNQISIFKKIESRSSTPISQAGATKK